MSDVVQKTDNMLTEDDVLELVDFDRLPRHVAIIMDGNRRWAKEKNLPTFEGHRKGTETFREIMITACEVGIEVLTVYAFSSENWRRTRDEVDFLMGLFVEYCNSEKQLMKDIEVQFRVIGNMDSLDPRVAAVFRDVANFTSGGKRMVLNVCINYGSRFEIMEAVRHIARDAAAGKIDPDKLTDDDLSARLYTAGLPDPDLMIRTSGELRISNFLLWQNAYSEFWFTDKFWPDFRRLEFLKAVVDYQKRDRRFGGATGTPSK